MPKYYMNEMPDDLLKEYLIKIIDEAKKRGIEIPEVAALRARLNEAEAELTRRSRRVVMQENEALKERLAKYE